MLTRKILLLTLELPSNRNVALALDKPNSSLIYAP